MRLLLILWFWAIGSSALLAEPDRAFGQGASLACCADLDERIAELETTVVRRGGRRMSLTLSGFVNTYLFGFNSDVGRDLYVADNTNAVTRFKLDGRGRINADWRAGFRIEIGLPDNNSVALGPDDDDNNDPARSLQIRQAYWFVRHDRIGSVRVGQQSTSTDGIAHIDLGLTRVVSFLSSTGYVRESAFGVTDYYSADGAQQNVVRFDSVAVAGFTVSASWGEDEFWDATLRYRGAINGLEVAVGAGYSWSNDDCGAGCDRSQLAISGSLWHRPSGLFVSASLSEGFAHLDARSSWLVKPGLRRRFWPIGATSVFVEYSESDIEAGAGTDVVGAGLVQRISAASTELYAGYRRYEDEAGDRLDTFIAGARVRF